MGEEYHTDYPTEPIGDGNPYWCCSLCGRSVPVINGQIKNHAEWCEYRKEKEAARADALRRLFSTEKN